MFKDIFTQFIHAIFMAAGQDKAAAVNLNRWEIDDLASGGRWFFQQEGEDTLIVAWSDSHSHDEQVCFLVTLAPYQGRLEAKHDLFRSPPPEQFRSLGIRVLTHLQDVSCSPLHRELNDLFLSARERRDRHLKGAMAEAGLAWETEPREELKNGAWERSEEPRLVRDIGLGHSNPTVRKAFEEAQRRAAGLGTMEERHEKLYQGSALDDQKDPSKVN